MEISAVENEIVGKWLASAHRFYISYIAIKDGWYIFRVTARHLLNQLGMKATRQAQMACGDFYVQDIEIQKMTSRSFIRHIKHLSDKAAYQEEGIR
ncbi:hypothetical protein [Komagataeibacter diospyri]|uniref:hypothetical protein n=1 Tax=Komagataeibacter diospyri TaxID=1932662 RepID=UPI003758329E